MTNNKHASLSEIDEAFELRDFHWVVREFRKKDFVTPFKALKKITDAIPESYAKAMETQLTRFENLQKSGLIVSLNHFEEVMEEIELITSKYRDICQKFREDSYEIVSDKLLEKFTKYEFDKKFVTSTEQKRLAILRDIETTYNRIKSHYLVTPSESIRYQLEEAVENYRTHAIKNKEEFGRFEVKSPVSPRKLLEDFQTIKAAKDAKSYLMKG